MPASRILALARTSRWLIVAGATRKAAAIRAASRPRTVCSISGACAALSMAGCAQTKSSFRRSSGNTDASPSPACCSASSTASKSAGTAASATCLCRTPCPSARRAAVSSQASGFCGTPGQRPSGQRRAKGVAQRILGSGNVARACRQIGQQPTVGLARREFGRLARQLVRHQSLPRRGASRGRTSVVPPLEDGHLAAQARAASRSDTSIT